MQCASCSACGFELAALIDRIDEKIYETIYPKIDEHANIGTFGFDWL